MQSTAMVLDHVQVEKPLAEPGNITITYLGLCMGIWTNAENKDLIF